MKNLINPIIHGLGIAIAGTLLMLLLLKMNLLGPNAILCNNEMIGGSILFVCIYLFMLLGIYLAIRERKHPTQLLIFRQTLFTGLVVSISAAIFSVLFTYLFYDGLSPNYSQEMIAAIRSKMELEQIPPERIAIKLKEKIHYYKTSTQALYAFAGNVLTGIAFTLLLSFIFKSKNS